MLSGCFGKTSHRFWTSNTPPRIHVKKKEEPKKAKKGGTVEQNKKGEDEEKEGGSVVELQGGFEYYLHHSMKRRRRKLERAKKKERLSESKGEGSVQGGARFNEKFYDELRAPEMDIYKKFLPMKCCLRYKFGYPAMTEEEWKKGNTLDIYKGLFFKRICEVILCSHSHYLFLFLFFFCILYSFLSIFYLFLYNNFFESLYVDGRHCDDRE